MIVIVEDRSAVADAYRASFGREGVAISRFSSFDVEDWVLSAADEDVRAIDAFLIGECMHTQGLAAVMKRRCTARDYCDEGRKIFGEHVGIVCQGVDDVVAKPCHVREILARIEAISRRARAGTDMPFNTDEIRIFRDGRDPIVRGEALRLPRRELRILEFLVATRSRRVTKSQIFSSVYGLFDQDIDETVIESHMSKLRRRLRQRLGYDPIESLRHLGYRLVCRSVSCDEPGEVERQDQGLLVEDPV